MPLPYFVQKTLEQLSDRSYSPLIVFSFVAQLIDQLGEKAAVIKFNFEEKTTAFDGKIYSRSFHAYALFYEDEHLDLKGNSTLEDIAKSIREEALDPTWLLFPLDTAHIQTVSYTIKDAPEFISQKSIYTMFPELWGEYKVWEHTFREIIAHDNKTALQKVTPPVSSHVLKSRF